MNRLRHGSAQPESDRSGTRWLVRRVGGGDKQYRCPGCDQLIGPGVGHLVVWPAEHLLGDQAGLDDRRHWHINCWRTRPAASR